MGPVISAAHREKVLSYIEKGIAEGATLALDGRAYKHPKHPEGYYLGPTIFTDVKPEMTIAREEIFGPVLSVFSWDDEDRMLVEVNGTELGLTASVWTTSLNTGMRAAKRIQ